MNFNENNKAIYLQIADNICDAILQGEFIEGERLPSVREYAASIEVNANTVMRSYERLASMELIFNKRGIGFFVADDAKHRIDKMRSEEMMHQQLPPIFKVLHLLGVTPDELRDAYKNFITKSESL